MSRESTLVLLGLLIALVPFIGLPYSWLMWILPVLGLIVLTLGVTLRAKRLPSRDDRHPLDIAHETNLES